ncbi:hypothetical protein [Streptomyces coffeae]|uniref:Uncharacterized protein n=1 Tax=Streptomyces coffeae TaxID=621382 RepID=A0ABS1NEW1_9ACTN|nr:hypothetical protein [Streptomyces coffeae]MBL1098505.1 hypothetical protein [Streptomyces coffeae]
MERTMSSSSTTRNRIRTSLLLLAALGLTVAGGSAQVGATTPAEKPAPRSPFLAEVAEQIALPKRTWTVWGTHTAKGYTTEAAETTNVEGMKADCENINLNKKLAADFRSDVFGPGVKGFFYRCQRIARDTNKYWFTISSADRAQIEKLCDPNTRYPIVYDEQHDTYWIDEPFMCTKLAAPA